MTEQINLEALHYYLSYKYVPSPLTILEGKSKQPLFDAWRLRFSPSPDLSETQVIDRLDEILTGAVRRLLPRPPALFLSGGIDSAVIAAISSRLSDEPINTFNLVFAPEIETPRKRMDRECARDVARYLGTRHRETVLTLEKFQGALPAIIRAIGEPYACNVSMYFLCDFARRFINRALAGDWADELFGSYEDHRLAYLYPSEDPWRIRYASSVFTDEEKRELYSEPVRQMTEGLSTVEHLRGYFTNLTAKDPLNRMLEGWLRSVFPDNTLMPVIKLSRAHSLSIDSPYADPELVDFVVKIPGALKMKGGEAKYVLKKLALRYLPEEFVYREKEYFTPPLLSLAIASEEYIRGWLSLENLDRHGLFDKSYVLRSVDSFFGAPEEELSYRIWTLLAFQVWHAVFLQ